MDVLFVCTGNSCRSPMAEAFLRELIKSKGLALTVGSAGIRAESEITSQAVRALRRNGVEINARVPIQLTEDMVSDAALVLCMTEEQRRILAEAVPACATKIYVWGEYVARHATAIDRIGGSRDIPDPIGRGDDIYAATAAQIQFLAGLTIEVLSKDH
jgi:protein-tyrosine-phosphatase